MGYQRYIKDKQKKMLKSFNMDKMEGQYLYDVVVKSGTEPTS